MTAQPLKPQAIFPDCPKDAKFVDEKGNIVPGWQLFFSQLSQALQANLSNEGFGFPSLTATQISTIQALYTPYVGHPLPQNDPTLIGQPFLPDISGRNVFDSTNRVPKEFIITYDGATPPNITAASWKTFTLT